MSDERYTFEQTRVRLEEILVQVKRKDTSLEQSLELLEEGVRLANLSNELIDQTSWRTPEPTVPDSLEGVGSDAPAAPDSVADASDIDQSAPESVTDDERA